MQIDFTQMIEAFPPSAEIFSFFFVAHCISHSAKAPVSTRFDEGKIPVKIGDFDEYKEVSVKSQDLCR